MVDWRPGDLAECIEIGDLKRRLARSAATGGCYLRIGMVYIVSGLVDLDGDVCLEVGVMGGPKLARRFRKVPPLQSDEPSVRRAPAERELEPA